MEPPPAPPSPFGDVEARFAALRAHPALDRMMRERPPAGAGVGGGLAQVGFGVLFGGVSFFIWDSGRGMRREFEANWHGLGGPARHTGFDMFDVMPPLFVAIGVGIALYGAYRVWRFVHSPWEAFPGLVVDERTHVSGGGQDSSTTTRYFVTVERENGRRHEYRTTGTMAGRVRAGDIARV